jgi:hypothetical protein
MGFFSAIDKPVRNPTRKPGLWIGGHPLVQSEAAWKYYKDRVEERSKPVLESEVPWAAGLGRRLTPDAGNPLWNEAAERAEKALRAAGMNPAAAAAAAARVGTAARLGLADTAREFWESLARSRARIVQDASEIQTMSPDIAYLNGFVGGGGSLGLASVAGTASRGK